MRVYLPLTLSSLADARARGSFGPAPLTGHAVTPALADELGDADEEESEYVAMTVAAQTSIALLGAADRPVRVVAALDVPRVDALPGGEDPTAVSVPDEVPWKRLAAVHVDSTDAQPDVAAARAALGGKAADEAAERCLDHELGWYAVQEVPDLLAALTIGPWTQSPDRPGPSTNPT